VQYPKLVLHYDEAIDHLRKIKGTNNFANLVWTSLGFQSALLTDRGFCGLWKTESEHWLIGAGELGDVAIEEYLPLPDLAPIRATIPRSWSVPLLEKRNEWNFFLVESKNDLVVQFKHKVEIINSDDEIEAFLTEHAPDSSTKPGDEEVQFWHGIRNTKGDLLAVGAASRWKSGVMMLVSITTHPEARGGGMAKAVTSSLAKELFNQGSPIVGLGVWAANAAAIRAYESVGFRLSEEFVSGPILLR